MDKPIDVSKFKIQNYPKFFENAAAQCDELTKAFDKLKYVDLKVPDYSPHLEYEKLGTIFEMPTKEQYIETKITSLLTQIGVLLRQYEYHWSKTSYIEAVFNDYHYPYGYANIHINVLDNETTWKTIDFINEILYVKHYGISYLDNPHKYLLKSL